MSYPDIIEAFSDSCLTTLENQGFTKQQIETIAEKITDGIQFRCGGCMVYVPKYDKRKQIIKGFNGNNQNELAVRHDISVHAVYKILKDYKKEKARLSR